MSAFINFKEEVITFGRHQLRLQTGQIARQADASIMVVYGEPDAVQDTKILVTLVAEKEVEHPEERHFLPLTVNYQERAYASGRIPGGYNKREGRPSERETLTSRLIDRPLRSLFPKGFVHEVQVIATVLSLNPQHDPEILALIGASAALALSGLPCAGPIAAARVGYWNQEYHLNPSLGELALSELDLVIAGTEQAVLMVESEALELTEKVMLGAVEFGHQQFQPVIAGIKNLAEKVKPEPITWSAPDYPESLLQWLDAHAKSKVLAAYQIQDKIKRYQQLKTIRHELADLFLQQPDQSVHINMFKSALTKLERQTVRSMILEDKKRIDGRTLDQVRAIDIALTYLPRVHGSAIFTRGETQAVVAATLGTERDAQMVESPESERRELFMLHYNFPPFCVGERGFLGSPKRREVGHGRLAKRALQAVLPTLEEFPYVLRVVSEITESNGSSSMASVCGTSLALMDAGVPLRAPVAGIAMGLIKEEQGSAILTDIQGDEDHLGDMDFKVAGSSAGITALQMDMKIAGIDFAIMADALEQAKQGREHILNIMNQALPSARTELSRHAPRIMTLKVDPERIRDVIGKGGMTIRSITEETGALIDVEDDGTIRIAATDETSSQHAQKIIERLTKPVLVGEVYEGTVTRIADFGAFINFLPGREGLVHISELAHNRVEKVDDIVQLQQTVQVKVIDVDRSGRIRLSIKALTDAPSVVSQHDDESVSVADEIDSISS